MEVRKFKKSGYSLIQLMIGLLIAVVLIGSALVSFLSGRKERQLSHSKTQLLSIEKQILDTLKADLDKAIRVTGRSSINRRPGIEGRTSPRNPTNDPFDMLTLYTEEFGHFSWTNIEIDSSNPPHIKLLVREMQNAAGALNESGFIFKILKHNDFFMISNLTNTNVMEKTAQSPGPIAGQNEVLIHLDPTDFQAGDFSADVNTLRAVSKVVYEIDNQKRLIRTQTMKLNGTPNKRVIAEGIQRFHLDYVAGQKNYRGTDFVPAPPGKEAPFSYLGEIVTSPAMTWSDIQGVRVGIEIMGKGPSGIQIASLDDSGFSLSNQNLVRSATFWIHPEKYSIRAFDAGFQGEEPCRLTDPASRCNPQFSHCFDKPDRNAADWAGYGDVNGPYCQCVDSSGRIPMNRAWENLSERPRIEACAQAFDACSSWEVLAVHPGMQLVCGCLQDGGRFYNRTPTNHPTLGYQTFGNNSQPMPAASEVHIPQPNQPNLIRCDRYQHLTWNGGFAQANTCDDSARRFYEGAATQNIWANACDCRRYDYDQNGNDDLHTLISGAAKNWIRTCGVQTSAAHPRCESTRASNGEFKLSTTQNPHGLTEEEATLCACIEQGQNPTNGLPSIPLSEGDRGGYNILWDFRAPRWDGTGAGQTFADPGPWSGTPSVTYGSHLSQVSTANIQNGPALQNRACAEAFCRDGRWGLSCVVHHNNNPMPPYQSPNPQLWPDPPPNPNWALHHSEYCSPNIPWWVSQVPDEIRTVRERITGTPPGGVLPPNCGGPNTGGSL